MNGIIQHGHGFWDITSFDVGGAFRRAPVAGVAVHDIKQWTTPYKGCTHEATTNAGRKVAFNARALK